MKDAREELDAGCGGGRVGRREGREREVVYREGAYLAHRLLSEVFIVARVIFHRPPTLSLGDT